MAVHDLGYYLHAQRIRLKTLLLYRNANWRSIPIRECNEPLVLVPPELCHPYYSRSMRIVEDDRIFLRAGVLDRFLQARKILSRLGYDLIVYDGWRSIELQENLFWFYLQKFTIKHFDLEKAFAPASCPREVKGIFHTLPNDLQTVLREANRTYVSWPSSDPECPSPHATGGAIDVWLHAEGAPLSLGVPYDWMEENAGAFYHLKLQRSSYAGNDKLIGQRRNHLLYAMDHAGFSSYGPEIWHFNFGNQMDSLVRRKPAIYSYIAP